MFVVQVQYIGENGLEEPVTVTHDGSESGTGFLIGGVFRTWESHQIMRLVDRLVANPKVGAIDITRREEKKTPAPSEKTSPPPPQQKKLDGVPLFFANILENYFFLRGQLHPTNEDMVGASTYLIWGDCGDELNSYKKKILERLPPEYENLRLQCGLLAELMNAHSDAFTDIPPL